MYYSFPGLLGHDMCVILLCFVLTSTPHELFSGLSARRPRRPASNTSRPPSSFNSHFAAGYERGRRLRARYGRGESEKRSPTGGRGRDGAERWWNRAALLDLHCTHLSSNLLHVDFATNQTFQFCMQTIVRNILSLE